MTEAINIVRSILRNQPIKLDKVTEIDIPLVAGRQVIVEAVVSSNSISYNVPSRLEGVCLLYDGINHTCRQSYTIDVSHIDMVKYVDSYNRDRINRTLLEPYFERKCMLQINEISTASIYKIRVRPLVVSLEVSNKKIVDERGLEYKYYDIYVVNKTINLEPGTIYRLHGIVIPDPQTQRVTMIVNNIEEIKSRNVNINNIKELYNLFKDKSLQERLDWILDNFEIYSKIINRRKVALASLLAFFSPRFIELDKIQRGWSIVYIIGDTTTGKSETVRQLVRLLKSGEIITAETASNVGITATTTQTSHGWFIEWGSLVLNDLKILAIDGAHKLNKDEWAALAESQRSGVVKIIKAAKNEAYARTRQILILNALADDRRNTRTLSSFYYPAQSLASVFDSITIARCDLTVFVSSDIRVEEINKEIKVDYDGRLEYLADLLSLVWNSKYEVIYEDNVIKEILDSATVLYNTFYNQEIPLCTVDMKYKIARLATALAALTCSFDDNFTKLIVKVEHVKYVTDFIKKEYSSAGLDMIALKSKESMVDDEVANNIIVSMTDILKDYNITVDECKEIIKWITLQSRFTKDQLNDKLGLVDKNVQKQVLAYLQNEELVQSSNRGFTATKKCIELAKCIDRLEAQKYQ